MINFLDRVVELRGRSAFQQDAGPLVYCLRFSSPPRNQSAPVSRGCSGRAQLMYVRIDISSNSFVLAFVGEASATRTPGRRILLPSHVRTNGHRHLNLTMAEYKPAPWGHAFCKRSESLPYM